MKDKLNSKSLDPLEKTNGRTKNSSFFVPHSSFCSRGFTLVEMLVVIGIIAVLVGASIGGFSAMTKSAEKAKAQELVSNVATALTAIFQDEGAWPKRLINGKDGGEGGGKLLDADAAYAFVSGRKKKYLSLSVKNGKPSGLDQFGVVSPWATAALKRAGASATETTKVGSGDIKSHTLRYEIDLDGDGIIEGVNVGGKTINVRATAIVWCCGKDGVFSPYPYGDGGSSKSKGDSSGAAGGKADDVYSWAPGQTRNVK